MMYAGLEATREWTHWLDNYKTPAFSIYLILIIIIYGFCVIFNAYVWIVKLKKQLSKNIFKLNEQQEKYKSLKKKRDALIEQHNIDLSDKTKLLNNIALLQELFNTARKLADSNKLEELNTQIDITRKVYQIEKDTNSKNN